MVDVVEALHVDEDGPIDRRARSGPGRRPRVNVSLWTRPPSLLPWTAWNFSPTCKPAFVGGDRAHHGVERVLGLEVLARGKLVRLVAAVFQVGEHLGHGADHAEALVGVAHAHRDGRLHVGGVFALGQLLVEAVGDVADRLAEVEDRVEDQLFLAALGADDQVVAFAAAVERLVDHAVDDQHGHDQRHAQAHRHDGQRRDQGPLSNASPGDFPETHEDEGLRG